jgi:pectate lyase C
MRAFRFRRLSVSLALCSLVYSAFACSDGSGIPEAGNGTDVAGSGVNAGSSTMAGSGQAQAGNAGARSPGGAGGSEPSVGGGAAQGGAASGAGGAAPGSSAGTSGMPAACSAGQCSGGTGGGGTGGGGTGGGGTTCSTITDYGVVNATIVVKNGETHDGQCKRYRAGSSLGDGSQSEGQKPMFVLESGARIRNVVLGSPAADGIHTQGDVTLENITWEDIGEDALTIKESGTVILNGGSAENGDDKVFQINAASTFRVSNFKASNAGKFMRQNGGTTFKVAAFIDHCDISDMSESIFRTDSSTSTVSMTNTRYHAIGDALFIGVSAGNATQSGNTQY